MNLWNDENTILDIGKCQTMITEQLKSKLKILSRSKEEKW